MVTSVKSGHLLQHVRSASDWSPAGVALLPSPGVVGDPLVLTVIADDVALQEDQVNTFQRNWKQYLEPT